ncbi:MAG TPA: YihY/virulence factor BrkB family protein [Acidimicrobiia bacterium]
MTTPGEGDDDLARRVGDDLAELRSDLAKTEEAVDERATTLLSHHTRGAAVARVLHAVMREQAEEQVGLAASGAAFWLIISAFPTAIAAVSIFGLVVSPGDVAKDLAGLADAGPTSLGSILTDQLQRVVTADHVGLSTGLVVSLVLAIWSASGGIYNLERAIRTAYGVRPQRYVDARKRAFLGAFATVIALGFVAIVSAGISGALSHVPALAVAILGIPAMTVFVAGAIAGLYRFSLARRIGFRAVLPGAIASACGLALVAVAFSLYLHFSTRFAAVYGALAGGVIAMVGTYLAVYVVLLGAVLNVQLSGPVAHELDGDRRRRASS